LRPAAVLGRDRIEGAEQDGGFGQVQRQAFGGKGCVHGLRRRRDAHSNDAGHVSSASGNVVQDVVQPVAYHADAGAVPIKALIQHGRRKGHSGTQERHGRFPDLSDRSTALAAEGGDTFAQNGIGLPGTVLRSRRAVCHGSASTLFEPSHPARHDLV